MPAGQRVSCVSQGKISPEGTPFKNIISWCRELQLPREKHSSPSSSTRTPEGGLRPRAVPEGLTARFPSEMTRLTPTHVFPQAACVARRGRTRTPFRGPLVLSKMARRLLVVFAWDPDAARVVVWRWARGWARLSGRCPPVASGGPCEAAAAGAGSEA